MSVSFLFIIVIGVGVLVIVALVVGLAVAAGASRRQAGPATSVPAEPTPVAPSTEERQAIMRRLANGELSKEQAEEELAGLGSPVTTAMPATPPPPRRSGVGCLIGLILAVLIPLLLLALLFFGHFQVARRHAKERVMEIRFDAEQARQRAIDEQMMHQQAMERAVRVHGGPNGTIEVRVDEEPEGETEEEQ